MEASPHAPLSYTENGCIVRKNGCFIQSRKLALCYDSTTQTTRADIRTRSTPPIDENEEQISKSETSPACWNQHTDEPTRTRVYNYEN